MMKYILTLGSALIVAFALTTTDAQAALIQFGLTGTGGPGLLASNETGVVTGNFGSGDIGPGGIWLDTNTNIMTIDIRWGSNNGYTDLTGNAIGMHIHLPTANPAPVGFGETAGAGVILNSLPGYNNSATSGGFIGSAAVTPTQANDIIAERAYINVHTTANGPGEVRGHLVVIPEPASLALLLPAGLLAMKRRR